MSRDLAFDDTASRNPVGVRADRVPAFLRGRRGLLVLGLALIAAGTAWQWQWLTAIGVAPVVLSLAPCAAMCAFGLCMNRMKGGGSCKTDVGQQSGGAGAETSLPLKQD